MHCRGEADTYISQNTQNTQGNPITTPFVSKQLQPYDCKLLWFLVSAGQRRYWWEVWKVGKTVRLIHRHRFRSTYQMSF